MCHMRDTADTGTVSQCNSVMQCHTRDAADISRMVSDKRSPPIFVQRSTLETHKYGKNNAGFSYRPPEP